MAEPTPSNHRPFLAILVIWGSLLVAVAAVAHPVLEGAGLEDWATPGLSEADVPSTEAAIRSSRAAAAAERRRRAAMTPTLTVDPADLDIPVRSGTRGASSY